MSILGTIESSLALVTAGVAVVGAVAGFIRWDYERRKDRRIRLEDSFDRNLQRIVEFPTADRPADASVVTALANLEALVAESGSGLREAFRARVTDAIDAVSLNDLDFENPAHASLVLRSLEDWPGWQDRLARDPDKRDFLIYRCRQALHQLHRQDPEYFESMSFDHETGTYRVRRYTDEKRYLLFSRLTLAYQMLIDLIKDADDRERAIAEYAEALENGQLARDVLRTEPETPSPENGRDTR